MKNMKKETCVLCYFNDLLNILDMSDLDDTRLGETMRAWWKWAQTGEVTQMSDKTATMLLAVLMNQTERDRERHNLDIENGKKGGRPKKEVNTQPQAETPAAEAHEAVNAPKDIAEADPIPEGKLPERGTLGPELDRLYEIDDRLTVYPVTPAAEKGIAEMVRESVNVPPMCGAELRTLARLLPVELIRYAVREAVSSGGHSWKYLRSILLRYIDRGFRTVDQVRAETVAFRKNTERARYPSPQDEYQHHEYTEADFEDFYYNAEKWEQDRMTDGINPA